MDSCNHCGQCKWILPHKMHGWDFAEVCPIYQYYGFDSCSGQGLINIAKEVLNGTVSFDPPETAAAFEAAPANPERSALNAAPTDPRLASLDAAPADPGPSALEATQTDSESAALDTATTNSESAALDSTPSDPESSALDTAPANPGLSALDSPQNLLFTCTACGACDVNCKSVRDMEVLDTIYALRADCAEKGALPESIKETGTDIINTHNIYGLPHESRCSWLPADCGETPDADTVLFLGCAASYQQKEVALAAIKILKKGGVPFRLLREEEFCCGAFLWRTGQTAAAGELVHRNIELFRLQGVRTLITACGECFGSFRSGYPRFEAMPCEVRHISEVAAELISDGKLLPQPVSFPGPVAWHDPCMLGRQSEEYIPWNGVMKPYGLLEPPKVWRRGEHGIYDSPREVLRAIPGLELSEMPRNCEDSFCCGAMAIDPKFRNWAASERRREAAASGAAALVTSCPFCMNALDSGKGSGLPCYDLSVLLADALPD